jgi:hypothetical protein
MVMGSLGGGTVLLLLPGIYSCCCLLLLLLLLLFTGSFLKRHAEGRSRKLNSYLDFLPHS